MVLTGTHGPPLAWEDHRAVERLLHGYAWHFDRKDAAGLSALFTADAVVDWGPEVPPVHGAAALADRVDEGFRALFAATSHLIGNVVVGGTPDGGAAATAHVHAWHRYADGSPDGYLWGEYHVQAVRGADGWRLASLRLFAAGTRGFHRGRMHPVA